MASSTHPTFTLLVSNQSFDLPAVDMTVRIDGERAVGGTFDVEGQHTWRAFDFGLDAGQHTIEVSSADSAARLVERFVVGAHNWGVLDFWYYPPEHYDPTPEMFTFQLLDQQPLFD